MSVLQLLVGCVAVYRLTVLLVDDRIMLRWRDWLEYQHDWRQQNVDGFDDVSERAVGGCGQLFIASRASSERSAARWGWLHYLFTCPWCVSIWLGFAVTLLAVVTSDELFVAICAPLVLSAFAGVAHLLVQRDTY